MVSAGISGTSHVKVKTEAKNYAGGKSSQMNDDFSKVLTEQGNNFKASESQKYASESTKDSVSSSKSEAFKKLFKENSICQNDVDTKSAEEAVSCVIVQADKLYQQITDELSRQFNVSVEEISECMDALGLDAADLFDKQNISKLIMGLTGEENMSALLVNTSLSETVMNIYSEAQMQKEDIMDELSMTQEEFEALLKKVDAAIAEMKDDGSDSDSGIRLAEVLSDDMASENSVEPGQNVQEEYSVSVDNVIRNGDTEGLQNNSENTDSENGMSREDGRQDTNAYGTAMMGSVIEGLKNAVDASQSVRESGISERIITRIVDEIRLNFRPDTTSLELQLEPESLGKVSIAVTSKAGVLTAHIQAQSEVAKEAIESQISTLREAFEAQGLKVEDVEVTLASRGFEQQSSQSHESGKDSQSKRGRHISKEELDEINGIGQMQEDMLVEDVLKDMGNTVSYSA